METKRDLRLYYYNNGVLLKSQSNLHKADNMTKLLHNVQILKNKGSWKDVQFLIVEYFGSFNSKIIELI